jgi:GlpG protein
MRLIGSLSEEKEAYAFSAFLLKEGIQNTYEPFVDPKTSVKSYLIWVLEENDFEVAADWLEKFKAQPNDPHFVRDARPFIPPAPSVQSGEIPIVQRQVERTPLSYFLTYFFLLLCVGLFFWDAKQEKEVKDAYGGLVAEIALTPLQRALYFDYPQAYTVLGDLVIRYPLKSFNDVQELPQEAQQLFAQAEAIPSWNGVFDAFKQAHQKGWDYVRTIPLFEKIRQGEVWRVFTPVLLHRDWLHILFNMAWLWILGRQIEERLPRWKMALLFLIVGIVSNSAQYLMGGSSFLGFSGIVVGLAGFIWVRQKVAPWEGYPLQRATAIFILVFVGAMFALELFSIAMELLSITNLSAHIANTAHIVGGLTGMLLGKIPFFSRAKI